MQSHFESNEQARALQSSENDTRHTTLLKYSLKFWKETSVVGTMKGRIGTRPWHTCQTTLFNLYPKSLIGKLRYVNDVKLTKEAKKIPKGWIERTFRQT